eukprot:GEMP01006240.1.p1 GENE.GEMP01006240.1~~GEMP01006240.1.p1  ORF type:complete len:858 (+),score=237.05 GEMP01006240.1:77-2650(+)
MPVFLNRSPGVQFVPFWDSQQQHCDSDLFSFERLYHASKLGIAADVREILRQWYLYEKVYDLNLRWKDGSTVLLISVQRGHIAVIRDLLATYPTAGDEAQDSTVYEAFVAAMANTLRRSFAAEVEGAESTTEAARRIEEDAADGNVIAVDLNLSWVGDDTTEYFGHTALTIASEDGREDIVCLLLEAEADVTIATRDGRNALSFAAQNMHVALVHELVERLVAAAGDINEVDAYGRTALHVAVQHGHLSVVEALLTHSVDVNPSTAPHPSPLFLAIHHRKTAIATTLLTASASPYDSACCGGDLHAFELCVLSGCEAMLDELRAAMGGASQPPNQKVAARSPSFRPSRASPRRSKGEKPAREVLLTFCATFAAEHNWEGVLALSKKVLRGDSSANGTVEAMEWIVRAYCALNQVASAHRACASWEATPDWLQQRVYALSPFLYVYHRGLRVKMNSTNSYALITTEDIAPNTPILSEAAAVPFCNHNVGEPEWVVEFASELARAPVAGERWRSWGCSESTGCEVDVHNCVRRLEDLHPRTLDAIPSESVGMMNEVKEIVHEFDFDFVVPPMSSPNIGTEPGTNSEEQSTTQAKMQQLARESLLLFLARVLLNAHDDGVHLSEAFMNHSCAPNCEVRGKYHAQIVSTRHIQAGDELCISYFKRHLLLESEEERIPTFQYTWGCPCGCHRCIAETQFREAQGERGKCATDVAHLGIGTTSSADTTEPVPLHGKNIDSENNPASASCNDVEHQHLSPWQQMYAKLPLEREAERWLLQRRLHTGDEYAEQDNRAPGLLVELLELEDLMAARVFGPYASKNAPLRDTILQVAEVCMERSEGLPRALREKVRQVRRIQRLAWRW